MITTDGSSEKERIGVSGKRIVPQAINTLPKMIKPKNFND
jgi:hypothetical protein